MSQAVQHAPTIGLHGYRRQLIALLVSLAVAAAIVIPLAVSDSDSTTASLPSASSIQTGGPNEAVRGQAASVATGATPEPGTGGPNETARGQAVHSSAGGTAVPGTGGPNEDLRGQAARSASH
jgi:hypothetical protein